MKGPALTKPAVAPAARLKPGELIQVAGPVWFLAGERGGQFPRCNTLLIRDRETALIDPGAGQAVLEPWVDQVDVVFNTHSHMDHSAGNHLFDSVEVLAPIQAKGSAGVLETLWPRFFTQIEHLPLYRHSARHEMGFVDRPPDGYFSPGQVIKVGRVELEVIHLPGHTTDHCGFYLPSLGLILSSDIDLSRFGPWYGHLESDLAQFRQSVELVKELDAHVLVSGHRLPLFGGINRALDDYLEIFEIRNQRILDFLAQERTREQVVDATLIYGRFPRNPELLRYWEGNMVDKHLAELVERGLVVRSGQAYRARVAS